MKRRFSSYTVKVRNTFIIPSEPSSEPLLCIEGDDTTSFLSRQDIFPEKIILPMRPVLKRHMPDLHLQVNQSTPCPLYADNLVILDSITLRYDGDGGVYYKDGTSYSFGDVSCPYTISPESFYCHEFLVLSQNITEVSFAQENKALYYPYGGLFQKDPMACQQLYIQAIDRKTHSDYLLIEGEHFDTRAHAHRISFFGSTPEEQPVSLGKALLQGACLITMHCDMQECTYTSYAYSEFFHGTLHVSFTAEEDI